MEASELLEELIERRDQSKDGVISFDEKSFQQFGAGKQRPYTLIIFLNAKQVMDNPQLAMPALRKEYGLASKAVKQGPNPDAAFFVEILFEDAPRVFHAVGANQVPYIFRVPGSRRVSLSEFPVADGDKMTFQTVGGGSKYPWPAETILSFFSELEAAEVHRPSLVKSPFFPVMVLGALLALAGLAAAMWWAGILHHPLLWALGSIAIFWFSVSGGMYNIIRGMPFFIRDKDGNIQFFLSSRGGQLGAEGFIVGSGYILFSCAVSLLTFAVPRVRSKHVRNFASYVLVMASGYMVLKIYSVFVSKTGYRLTSYLFRG